MLHEKRFVHHAVRAQLTALRRFDLGTTLGLRTIAEGIETAEERDLLRMHGCRYGQGFLLARPMPAGAHTVHRTDIPGFLTHIMGTMRMGTDPAISVVGPDGEAHEVERLFVADSSVPPADGGANPTLTAQAFATRTADRIAAKYFE